MTKTVTKLQRSSTKSLQAPKRAGGKTKRSGSGIKSLKSSGSNKSEIKEDVGRDGSVDRKRKLFVHCARLPSNSFLPDLEDEDSADIGSKPSEISDLQCPSSAEVRRVKVRCRAEVDMVTFVYGDGSKAGWGEFVRKNELYSDTFSLEEGERLVKITGMHSNRRSILPGDAFSRILANRIQFTTSKNRVFSFRGSGKRAHDAGHGTFLFRTEVETPSAEPKLTTKTESQHGKALEGESAISNQQKIFKKSLSQEKMGSITGGIVGLDFRLDCNDNGKMRLCGILTDIRDVVPSRCQPLKRRLRRGSVCNIAHMGASAPSFTASEKRSSEPSCRFTTFGRRKWTSTEREYL